MNMRHALFAFLLAGSLLSCSKPEWFENDQPEIDFFAVPEDATGEKAELRRNFFNERGVYLLFNDTLGIRQTPTLSGDTMTNLQVIDFLWDMTPSDQYRDSIKFVYQNDEAQRRAATSFFAGRSV